MAWFQYEQIFTSLISYNTGFCSSTADLYLYMKDWIGLYSSSFAILPVAF